MPYRNLDEFLIRLEHSDSLVRLDMPVRLNGELSQITREQLANKADTALWFDNVEDSKFPVVSNILGTSQRMAWALGIEALDDLATRVNQLLSPEMPQNMSAIMGRAGELLGMMRNITPIRIKHCQHCVQDVVMTDAIDLHVLPISKNYPNDSHSSINLVQLITPDTISVTQASLIDQQTLAIPQSALQGLSQDKKIPCAIVIGCDPAIWWSGLAPLPANISPYLLAGWLRNRPVSLLSAVTQPVLIPHDAEFVLEGWIDPKVSHNDIVFADESGQYIHELPHVTMHITAITHRQDAVYPAYIPNIGEFNWIHQAIVHMYLPLLRILLQGVVDIAFPSVGSWRNLVLLRIEKRYRGHAEKIMHGIWGLDGLAYSKTIVIVDADIDIDNLSDVALQILRNVNWATDITQVKGVLHPHDRSSADQGYGAKLGINATRKSHPPVKFSPLQAHVLTKAIGHSWINPIAGLIIVQQTESNDVHELCQQIWAIQPDHHIVVIDDDPNTQNISTLATRVLANINWARDIISNPSSGNKIIAMNGKNPPEMAWIEPVTNQRGMID